MKNLIIKSIPVFLIAMFLCCNDNSTESGKSSAKVVEVITAKPVVIKTSTNYSEELFRNSFPKQELLNNIGEAYQKNYSCDLKNQLINYIVERAVNLGESGENINECMDVTGCKSCDFISLPTYAERAKFAGEDAWIIQLVWGAYPSDLSHYKCFAISMNSKDTLYLKRCK